MSAFLQKLKNLWPFRGYDPANVRQIQAPGRMPLGPSYISRPPLEKRISSALARHASVVVYGSSNHGKTTLLTRRITSEDVVYIECRPGFKRTQIYRVILSSLGYAITVEKKRRSKGASNATLSLGVTGATFNVEGEIEHKLQSVTLDLKNASEVVHLISRAKNVPAVVLNNFHLLDAGTKENFLFDLLLFLERPRIQFIIVGSWANEEYLEEIEPAVAGRLEYIYVHSWTEPELREAANQWAYRKEVRLRDNEQIQKCIRLARGDISLFHSLLELEENRNVNSREPEEAPSADSAGEDMVAGRFRRSLRAKLRGIFASRDSYVYYKAYAKTSRLLPNVEVCDYDLSHPDYSGRARLPRYEESLGNEGFAAARHETSPPSAADNVHQIVLVRLNVFIFILKQLRQEIMKGGGSVDLSRLVEEFVEYCDPKPLGLDKLKLKNVFRRVEDTQRQALVNPFMVVACKFGEGLEVTDSRLKEYLRTTSLEELDDLCEEAQPSVIPKSRLRNQICGQVTREMINRHLSHEGPQS